MDRKYIDDHHIVARYLADSLAESEREAFEAYYLEHPEVVKEMETVARFKAGLLHLQQTGELDQLINAPARTPRWQLFAAATAAIAVGVAFFVYRDTRSTPPLLAATLTMLAADNGSPLPIASSHRIFRTRSSAADADIQLPVPVGAIELEIQPEFDDASTRYRVVLVRVEGTERQRVATLDALTLNPDGLVPVYLNSALVFPGRYELELSSESHPDQISVFSIRARE